MRWISTIGLLAASLLLPCRLAAQIYPNQYETLCPAGQTVVSGPTGSSYDPVTNKYRAVFCIDGQGNITMPGASGAPGGSAGQAQVNDPGNPGHFNGSPCFTFTTLNAGPISIPCDQIPNSQNPGWDVRAFGARFTGNADNYSTTGAGITADCVSGNFSITLHGANVTRIQTNDWLRIEGCGPAQTMTTPTSPTVTPSISAGPTGVGANFTKPAPAGVGVKCFIIAAFNTSGGLTAGSPEVCTSTSNPYGLQTVSITSASKSGHVNTYTTSAAHGFLVGCASGQCGVGTIFGTSDRNNFDGPMSIASAANSTTFTANVGTDTAYGAGTTSTGGTLSWWNVDDLTLPAYTAGMWKYGIWCGASGAEVPCGIATPNISLVAFVTELHWDWYGQTFTTPQWMPSAPPVAARNNYLMTQCLTGCGTSSITVSVAPSVTLSGQVLVHDDGQAIVQACTQANQSTGGGGKVIIPAASSVPAVSESLWITSYANLAGLKCNIENAALIRIYDTLDLSGTIWNGIINPGNSTTPANGVTGANIINAQGYPGIYSSQIPIITNTVFTQQALGGVMYIENPQVDHYARNVAWIGASDNYGVPFISYINGFGWRCDYCTWSRPQQASGTTLTPAGLFKGQIGELDVSHFTLSGAGFGIMSNTGSGGVSFHFKMSQECQGCNVPMMMQMFLAGGSIGGFETLEDFTNDTGGAPLFSNLTPSNAGLGVTLRIQGSNAASGQPLISGAVVSNLEIATPGLKLGSIGQNYNITFAGLNSASVTQNYFGQPISVGGPNFIFHNDAPPAAPTCSITAGGSVPLGTYTIGYAPAYPGAATGVWGTMSFPSASCTTTSGNQTLNWTIPAAVPGVIGYQKFLLTGPLTGQATSPVPDIVAPALTGSFANNFTVSNSLPSQAQGSAGIGQGQVNGAAVTAGAYQTAENCAVNSVSPAACGNAASGAFVVPTTTTTYTVNTSKVTSHSRITLTPITFAADLPSAPTCVAPAAGAVTISAIVAGTSFTMALPSTTGQTCWYYSVEN